jgi:hypothetical protein
MRSSIDTVRAPAEPLGRYWGVINWVMDILGAAWHRGFRGRGRRQRHVFIFRRDFYGLQVFQNNLLINCGTGRRYSVLWWMGRRLNVLYVLYRGLSKFNTFRY